jgi:predicted ArsR family transcriptional regulator
MDRERSKTGEFKETVTLDAVLDVFTQVPGPIVTSADIADALDCSRETARRKLSTLQDQNVITSRETAGRVVWWRTEAERASTEIDPDDPLFTGGALFASEDPLDEDNIDDVLYGEVDA